MQSRSDDREWNQARSKADMVDRPVRTARTFKGVLRSKKWISQNYIRRVVYVYTSYFR